MLFQKPDVTDWAPAVSGEASTLGEVLSASWGVSGLGGQWMTDQARDEAAIDAHNDRIFKETGARLDNPLRRQSVQDASWLAGAGMTGGMMDATDHMGNWRKQLRELAAANPDKASLIDPEFDYRREAGRQAKAAEERLASAVERSPYTVNLPLLGPANPAALAAGFASGATNPFVVATLPIGGAAVGVGAREVLWQALRMAGANAAGAAAEQPLIKAWRQSAGLDYSWGDAGKAVAEAALFGFVLEGAVRGGSRAMRNALGREPVTDAAGGVVGWRRPPHEDQLVALDQAARQASPGSVMARAAEGDGAALARVARDMGLDRDPEVRAAIAALEADAALPVPAGIAPADHAARLDDAVRNAVDPRALPVTDALPAPKGEPIEGEALRAILARDPLDIAAELRDRPELLQEHYPWADRDLRQAVHLSRLSPQAFERVLAGDIAPEVAALVAEHVPDVSRHTRLAEQLQMERPASPQAARARLAELLVEPRRVEEHAAIAGGGVKPGRVHLVDDPHGADAARQLEQLRAEHAEALAKVAPETAGEVAGAKPTEAFADPVSGAVVTADDVTAIVDMWRYVQETKRAGMPQTLSQFLIDLGRVQDQNGELTNILGGRARHLISGSGRTLDDAAEVAWEAGFFSHRPTVREFLEAIDDDVRGNPRVRAIDEARLSDVAVARDMANELDQLGVGNAKSEADVRGYFAAGGGKGAQGGAEAAGAASRGQAEAVIRKAIKDRAAADLARAIDEAAARLPLGVTVKSFADLGDLPQFARDSIERAQMPLERIAGLTDEQTGNIWIARGALDARATLAHETIHSLVTRGVMTAGELRLLAEHAAKIDGLFNREVYRQTYAGRADAAGQLAQEEAAHLYEAWAGGQRFGKQVDGILSRISQFFERVRNALRGLGYQTADDIMRAIDKGEMAGRATAAADGGQAMFALSPDGTVRAYHGTQAEFDRLSLEKVGGIGINFGTLRQAEAFAGGRWDAGDGSRIIPATIPADVKFMHASARIGDTGDAWNLISAQDPARYRGNEIPDARVHEFTPAEHAALRQAVVEAAGFDPDKASFSTPGPTAEQTARANAAARQWLSERGFGGIVWDNIHTEGNGLSYMVWQKGAVTSPVDGRALFSFGGESARTADLAKLAEANKLERSGSDRTAIWNATGWFRGVDGRWRFEINDRGVRWQTVRALEKENGRLRDFFDHGKLFDAYPQLADFPATSLGRGAAFVPASSTVRVGAGVTNHTSTAAHEVQHAVQGIEGFAHGANLNMARATPQYAEAVKALSDQGIESGWTSVSVHTPDTIADGIYRQFAGEVEARAVQSRLSLTPEERAARPPWLDYDVPESQQIVMGHALFSLRADAEAMLRADLDEAAAMADARAKASRERQALIDEGVRKRNEGYVTTFRDARGQVDPARALVHLIESHGEVALPAGMTSVAAEQKAVEAMAKARMEELLHEFRPNVAGNTRNRARLTNVVRELAGEGTGDAAAAALAKVWASTAERLRQEFNAAGGDILKLEGWYLPQMHDRKALLATGQRKWIEDTMRLLDHDRIRDGATREVLSPAEIRTALGDIWQNIVSDGHGTLADNAANPFGGITADATGRKKLANQRQEHRFLHFKNADAWLEYQTQYGGGADPFRAMMEHVTSMSKGIAALRVLGTNPDRELARLAKFAQKQASLLRPADVLIDEAVAAVKDLNGQLLKAPRRIDEITDRIGDIHKELDRLRRKRIGPPSSRTRAKMDPLRDELFGLERERGLILDSNDLALDGIEAAAIRAKLDDAYAELAAVQDADRVLFPRQTEILGRKMQQGGWWSTDPQNYANGQINRARQMWQLYRGATSAPVNAAFAETMQGARNIGVIGRGGSMVISSLADNFAAIAARQYAGSPIAPVFTDVLRQFSTANRREAARSAVIAETYLHMFNDGARAAQAVTGGTWTHYLAERTIAAQGLSRLTDAQRQGFAMSLQGLFADLAPFSLRQIEAENANLARLMRRYGLSEADWNAIRLDAAGKPHEVDFLSPNLVQGVADATGTAADRVAERYLGMILQETDFASPTAMLRARAVMVGETRPGTIVGEVLRTGGQFKSFAVMFAMLHTERALREAVANGAWRGAQYAGMVLAVTTLAGALVVQLKDIKGGKDPQPMNDPKFWGRAALQGGGLGIMGDLINAETNRFGGGIMSTMGGPVVGIAEDVLKPIFTAKDKQPNPGRPLAKLATSYVPGSSLWYVNLAWQRVIADQLQKTLDPEAHKAFAKRAHDQAKDYGNDYFWAPGDRAAARGPRFDRVFGR